MNKQGFGLIGFFLTIAILAILATFVVHQQKRQAASIQRTLIEQGIVDAGAKPAKVNEIPAMLQQKVERSLQQGEDRLRNAE